MSLVGFAINTLVAFVLLWRGRRKYHLLFAALLITIPMNFLPAVVYHFTTTYLNQPRRMSTIALYAYSILGFILVVSGTFQPVTGVYS